MTDFTARLRLITSLATIAFPVLSWASELREGELPSKLVPSPVEYAVLLPDSYGNSVKPLPLLVLLHGGNGSHRELGNQRTIFEELWAENLLPDLVVVTPSAKRSLYMDYKDASEQWERFILGPFLDHIRGEYKVSKQQDQTLIAGASMGGLGALRIAFKNPNQFAGVVAFEPGIMPALMWKDVKPRHRFFRSNELLETLYGRPFDPDYWEANNPASIAKRTAMQIRESGLQIYVECGDADFLNLHEGAEFLHRLLWDEGVKHEYHLVRGADHLGRTLKPRFKAAATTPVAIIKSRIRVGMKAACSQSA